MVQETIAQDGELLGDVLWPRSIRAFTMARAGVLGRTLGDLDEGHIIGAQQKREILACVSWWDSVASRSATSLSFTPTCRLVR